jgi:hypothetical protein
MCSNRPLFFCTGSILLALSGAALAADPDVAPKYKILHAFNGRNDGAALWGSLLLDDAGPGGDGVVFEVSP